MMKTMLLAFFLPCAITYCVTFFVKTAAKSFDIVDKPAKRKIHSRPVPLLGGLAIFAGVCIALLVHPHVTKRVFPLFVGATCILIVNLIDDIRGLPARTRFIAEFIIAFLVIIFGVRVSFLPPGLIGGMMQAAITMIWLVGVTNAFNYLDGMDGLAVGSCCINACYFSLILFFTGQVQFGTLALILAGACLGFLPHNFKQAKIFLGDAGSTFLGFMLASLAVAGNWAHDNFVKLSIPILILGVPIFDMIFTTIIRFKEAKVKTFIEWLKYGGKDHFHHYLVYLGLYPTGAVLFIWTVTFALGLSAVMVSNDKAWEAILTLFQAAIIFTIIGVLIVVGRRRRSGWKTH